MILSFSKHFIVSNYIFIMESISRLDVALHCWSLILYKKNGRIIFQSEIAHLLNAKRLWFPYMCIYWLIGSMVKYSYNLKNPFPLCFTKIFLMNFY